MATNMNMELEIFDDDLDAEGMMKILVIGGVNNGKTSIISKACYNNMESEKTINTIGVGFHTKKIHMDSKPIKMCFWDFSGQDRFLCLTRCYFNEANAAIVVTDGSRSNSLDQALNWKRELDKNFTHYKIPTFLFVNKYDLIKDDPIYTEQQLNQITRDNGFDKWAYTSAKDGYGIEDAIEELVRQTMKESYHQRSYRHLSMRDSFKLGSRSATQPISSVLAKSDSGQKCSLPKEKKRCCS